MLAQVCIFFIPALRAMQDTNSCTVLTTHFVIDFINYTYSKLVELCPMTLAPTNEDSGGYTEE